MTTHNQAQGSRVGFKRWIVLALLVAGGIFAWGLGGIYKPISPVVVIPGEPVIPSVPGFTNTMLAILVADLIVLFLGFTAFRFVSSGQKVPSGIYNGFEALVEWLYNSVEGAAPKRFVQPILYFVATIFFLVFAANMSKLMPGYEAIGWVKEAHAKGHAAVEVGPFVFLDGNKPISVGEHGAALADSDHALPATGDHSEPTQTDDHGAPIAEPPAEEHAEELKAGCAPEKPCEVVPFLRGAATDLNFTFALAISVMVMVQIIGLWALGPSYLLKFFNFTGLISKPGFGIIDAGVGLLELVSEFSKILSFSFRLFGNIFAGTLLLSILGTLLPVGLPVGLYLFEMFFGSIQAYVFAMLTLVFMSQATVSHHGDDHGDHAHAEAHH